MQFRFVLTVALAATVIAAAACGGGDGDSDNDTNSQFSQTQQAGAGRTPVPTKPCVGREQEPASIPPATTVDPSTLGGDATKTYAAEPPMTIDPEKTYIATIKMDIGDMRIRLFPKDAPTHVNNFVFLARDGFYDGVTFHRVLPGFMAQAGDPEGTGRGGPGYTIKDEVNGCTFEDGTLGMAKTQLPNSAGSQFFITLAPAPHLDGGYTVFGTLIDGRDVLSKIELRDPARATTPGTKINTITIEEQ